MNNLSKPLDEPKVRQAISAAIDRDQINDIAYLGQNKVLGSFLPSTMEVIDSSASTDRDIEKAKELLKGTACQGGCNLNIMVRSGFAPFDSISTIIQQNLADVGITVALQTVEPSPPSTPTSKTAIFQMEVSSLYDLANAPELTMLPLGLTPMAGSTPCFRRTTHRR